MRSSLRSALFVVAAAGAAALPASSAQAMAFCSFEVPVTLSPGLSAMTPSSGTFTTGGQTGKLMCQGDAYGKAISAPGTVGYDGILNSQTCANGDGTGTARLVLPTASGPLDYTYTFTYQRAGLFGEFTSDAFSGGFTFQPTKGDCVSSPVTAATVRGTARFG
jgi:hypothetical protein